VYENSDSYRKFVNLERYGLNPMFYAPSAVTKIQLSYEYFHDQRTTDAASLHNWFSETPGR
jgi:catecholate siderophore receptor